MTEQVMRASLGTGIANKITAVMKDPTRRNRRQLYGVEYVFAERMAERALRELEKGTCPMGMDTCDTNVVDFFCTGRDGQEILVGENGEKLPEEVSEATGLCTLRFTLISVASAIIGFIAMI